MKHETIAGLTRHATVPVINGLTDYNHPTQVVCDTLTMIEHMPACKKLEDLNVTFVGDATNVLRTLMLITTHLGMHFIQAAPSKYQAPAQWLEMEKANCAESGGSFTLTEAPVEVVKNADYIYIYRPVVVGRAGGPDT